MSAWLAGAYALGGAAVAFLFSWAWARVAYGPRERFRQPTITVDQVPAFVTQAQGGPAVNLWWDEFLRTWADIGRTHCMRAMGITPIRRRA